MKKLFLLLSFIIFLNHCYSQVSYDSHHKGVTKYIGSTTNGLRQGVWKKLTWDGFTVSETNYFKGVKKGDYYQYSTRSKQIIIEGQYLNNMRVGEWIYYGQYSALVDSILFYRRGIIIKKY